MNRGGRTTPASQAVRELAFFCPLPPFAEQAAIVRYLDYVDRRVRRYVSAKERLIGLLEEEKQAVINRAVTCGLDPNVPLKPSGVEWLGDVPEHWDNGNSSSPQTILRSHRARCKTALSRASTRLRRGSDLSPAWPLPLDHTGGRDTIAARKTDNLPLFRWGQGHDRLNDCGED